MQNGKRVRFCQIEVPANAIGKLRSRQSKPLSTQLLQLREQLRNKERYASGLEILLRQRNERIDQLTAQVDAVAAKQSMACVTG